MLATVEAVTSAVPELAGLEVVSALAHGVAFGCGALLERDPTSVPVRNGKGELVRGMAYIHTAGRRQRARAHEAPPGPSKIGGDGDWAGLQWKPRKSSTHIWL